MSPSGVVLNTFGRSAGRRYDRLGRAERGQAGRRRPRPERGDDLVALGELLGQRQRLGLVGAVVAHDELDRAAEAAALPLVECAGPQLRG
jgi:hypothetical protein